MTGEGEGKYELKGAKVYIHEEGKSRAKITHIDIEHPLLNKIIKPKESTYCGGKKGGVFIGLKKEMLERVKKAIDEIKSKI